MRNLLLKMEGITKHFPGVLALNGVDFDLYEGEVHVLLGENGAGKSTLIKILSGAYEKDSGRMKIEGEIVEITSPHQAQDLGISTIYQEFNLVPYLSVAENIFLGREPIRGKLVKRVDKEKMNEQAEKLLLDLGVDIDPALPVYRLGVADKQMVEITKALSMSSRICIMDEPTAALSAHEIDELFQVIKRLKKEGVGVIYISHRLEEIHVIGDRITVLRDGEKIGTVSAKEIQMDKLIQMMVGREIESVEYRKGRVTGDEVLRVENLSSGEKLQDINFLLRKGEILGLAGLVGSGRTELARAIFGADPFDKGSVYIKGKPVSINSPQEAVSKKIAYLPEDRKFDGLVLVRSVQENIVLPSLKGISHNGFLTKSLVRRNANPFIDKLSIKTPSLEQMTMFLSGGNQQKVVIAKWLCSQCDIFLFDEPTRGVDVGAKMEIRNLIMELSSQGAGILLISSELQEILQICDRVLVMYMGTICAEFSKEEATQEKILECALMGNNRKKDEL